MLAAKKLVALATGKFLELCNESGRLKDREYLELEISVFLEGILWEYVKYCRGISTVTPDDLYAYTKKWHKRFVETRF